MFAALIQSIHYIQNQSQVFPDSKVHVAHMGPTWGRQDPGGPHVGPMNLAIRDYFKNNFVRSNLQ